MSVTYELYSWQDSKGDWNFSIFHTTNRNKTVKEIFNKKTTLRGLDRLKRRISDLPAGSTIVLVDRVTEAGGVKVKGSEKLRYPPTDIIDDIRRHAEARHIQIVGPGPS